LDKLQEKDFFDKKEKINKRLNMILYIIQRKKIMKSLLILHSLNSSLCSEWQILC